MSPILTKIAFAVDVDFDDDMTASYYEVAPDPKVRGNFLLRNENRKQISLPADCFQPVEAGRLFVGCVNSVGVEYLTEGSIYSFDGCINNPYIRVCNDQQVCRAYRTNRFAVLQAEAFEFPKPPPLVIKVQFPTESLSTRDMLELILSNITGLSLPHAKRMVTMGCIFDNVPNLHAFLAQYEAGMSRYATLPRPIIKNAATPTPGSGPVDLSITTIRPL